MTSPVQNHSSHRGPAAEDALNVLDEHRALSVPEPDRAPLPMAQFSGLTPGFANSHDSGIERGGRRDALMRLELADEG